MNTGLCNKSITTWKNRHTIKGEKLLQSGILFLGSRRYGKYCNRITTLFSSFIPVRRSWELPLDTYLGAIGLFLLQGFWQLSYTRRKKNHSTVCHHLSHPSQIGSQGNYMGSSKTELSCEEAWPAYFGYQKGKFWRQNHENSFIGPGISFAAPWPWICLAHSMIFYWECVFVKSIVCQHDQGSSWAHLYSLHGDIICIAWIWRY